MRKTVWICALLCCGLSEAAAQDLKGENNSGLPGMETVVSVRELERHRSRAALEADMLSAARITLTERVSGIDVRSAETLTTSETAEATERGNRENRWYSDYLHFTRQETSGRITNEADPVFETFKEDDRMMLRLTYSAKVDTDSAERDPGLHATLRTHRPAYRPEDTIRIEVESSRDAQLYLFNISPKGIGTLIWPNAAEKNNSLARGRRTYIPKSTERYAFVAELPEDGSGGGPELLYGIIFTGKEQLFNPEDAFVKTWRFDELNRIIMQIPARMRTEVTGTYGIMPE